MLDNVRPVPVWEGVLWAAAAALVPSLATWVLVAQAQQAAEPARYTALAVFAVAFPNLATAYVHWYAAMKIAWNIAHSPQAINVTLDNGERYIPELGPDDKPLRRVKDTNASAFETAAAVRAIDPRKLVRPNIPEFVTVTQMTALAYGALAGEKLTIREWAGKGKPFSDPQWRQLKGWMIQRGFWDCVDDRPNSKIMMTDSGRAWMQSITVAFPPPLKTYRHKG